MDAVSSSKLSNRFFVPSFTGFGGGFVLGLLSMFAFAFVSVKPIAHRGIGVTIFTHDPAPILCLRSFLNPAIKSHNLLVGATVQLGLEFGVLLMRQFHPAEFTKNQQRR